MTSRILVVFAFLLFVSACSSGGADTSSFSQPPAVNTPPVVDAGVDTTIRLPDDTVALDGTVTDDGLPSGAALSTAWSVQSGPAGATFADVNAVDTTVTFVSEGNYGYLGQDDPVLHFGLGAHQLVDVVVDFLDGTQVQVTETDVAANQQVVIGS